MLVSSFLMKEWVIMFYMTQVRFVFALMKFGFLANFGIYFIIFFFFFTPRIV